MTIVNVTEDQQPLKYLIVTQQKDTESLITTRVLISDNRTNQISLVSIEKGVGIEGKQGLTGSQGPAGKDGVIFEILPISSGGTNNTTFTNDKIIYYDGNSLTSSNYSINELISSTNAITGVIAGTGLLKTTNGNSVTINTNLGDGLTVTASKITVNNTIARKSELTIENILRGYPLSINQGGTNNDSYVGNKLLYYDGYKISSFPLQTGLIVLSGTKINIVAGSGLIGGGDVSLPNGSVVLNIGPSSDIVVQEDIISLSNTGTPGTYTRITTDSKGRVINGGVILSSDILSALGYTPWHSGNDGSGSKLDADFLDGLDSSYFLNFYNLTGTINTDILPVQVASGTYSKVKVNNKGLVIDGQSIGYSDVVNALNYVPLSTSGGMISGSLIVRDKTVLSGLIVKDNLPMFGYNNREILPSYPRGFQFQYGGRTSNSKTGVLAYYPVDQELRLITDISIDDSDLDGGGHNDAYIDDVDGGDANSVYVVGSYQGTTGVVLLRHVADQRYVSIANNQNINGSKTFTNRLTAYDGIDILPKQTITRPPLYVSNNSGLVINFNSDLLHGRRGAFYRNAVNLTGVLKYDSRGISGVLISNLSGTPKYIAKFDDRSNNPSATVSDSLLFEENNTITVDQQGNLCIGTGNVFQSGSSLAVGVGNQIYSNNSLAVGFENIVLQDNSVSIGTNASGWIKNQFSFGAFRVIDDSNNQSKGQYSTVAMYLDADNGQEDAWVDMKPRIIIPKDKTMAYSAEILMNKVGGIGVAYILFNSGIITKRTISDENFQPINITKIVQNPVKNEIFNDSQIKKHYYTFSVPTNNSDGSSTKFINIKPPPLEYTPLSGQNIEPSYKYKQEFVKCTGTFIKTNDGLLDVIIDKPIHTGWYTQNAGDYDINIKSYDHIMTTGCLANLSFDSSSDYASLSGPNAVISIIDKDNFVVSGTSSPIENTSGTLTLNQKRSYPSCLFTRTNYIKKYDASYVRNDYNEIVINNYNNTNWEFDPSYSTYFFDFQPSFNGPDGPNPGQYHPSDFIYAGSIITSFKVSGLYITPYVSGLLSIYPESGTGIILITTPENLNIENNEDSTYLRFLTTSTGLLPETRPYSSFLNTTILDQQTKDSKEYRVINTYLYPNTGLGVDAAGLVDVNLDKNHGFKILANSDIINELPVNFINTIDCPSDRLPTDNLFSIESDSIHGHRISVKDSDNYILKSSGPDYFEQPISAIYNIAGLPSEIKITGVGVPRLYVNTNDIIKIVEWNTSSNIDKSMYNYIKIDSIDNSLNSISCIPISDTGLLGLSPYVLPQEFGTLKFVCVSSGFCDIPISNNIYYHSYGGPTSSYLLDSDGKFVNAPQTGIYTISSNSSTCSSGTLCVNIIGFGGTVFSNVQDVISRANIGKTPNITSDSKGYVRPWGNNQKFYFDFSDGAPNINGVYYINDKLSPNSITISVPYNDTLINTSGLVYVIDSNENIKSNLNPNKDNFFIVSDINGASTIKDYEIKSFNKNTRRWKHLVHLKDDPSIAYASHPFSVGSDNSVINNFSSDDITIPSTGILYSLDDQTYVSVTGDNTITIPNDTSSVFLKINTINGAKKWDDNNARSAPKINISGLTNYIIAGGNIADITFSDQQWTIPVTINQLQSTYNNRPIAITVSDEAGSYTKNLFLNTKYIPRIDNAINKFFNNIAGYVNRDDHGSSWFLTFDIKYYDPSKHSLSISNYPGDGAPSSLYDFDTKTLRINGNYNSSDGIYNTVVNISSQDGTILSTATGVVLVCNSSSLPSYTGIFDGLDDEIYLDATDTDIPSFSFYIPTASNNPSNAIIPVQNIHPLDVMNGYSSVFSINSETSQVTPKGYKCTLTLSNVYTGRYPMSIELNVIQRTPDNTTKTFSISKNININIYKKILIDQIGMFFPILSDIQQPWSVSFKVQNGICGINQSKPPDISLSNLPVIGNYTSQPLEYNINKTYNAINKNWNIVVSGKKDINEIYTNYTGIWPISILAQDQFNSSSATNNLQFTEYPYIENALDTYGTPNNLYFTTIDIKQSNNQQPQITIAQESTAKLQPSSYYYKYDQNLKLWEYAYDGGPMVDKWDSQILLNNQTSELQIQCKGMGNDKVYGVCKLNLIELDTVGLAKIPLRIIDLNANYNTVDGSIWKITFKTEHGLADRLYPPRILLEGLPTSCAGFNPPISQSQAVCCVSPEYENGKWKYEFNGIPLCFQAGNIYNFIVRAFDTVDGTQILGSAIAYSKITYTALDDHPIPVYKGVDNIELSPYPLNQPSICKNYVNELGFFGTATREICPVPTGLKNWSISGSVPPGLSYQITYAGAKGTDGFPAAPYSDAFVSGQLRIIGFPNTFPPNGDNIYNEKLTLKFTDARNNVGIKQIKFTDITEESAEPLADFTVYFDSVKPVYTPGTGIKIIVNEDQTVYQPPANAASLLPGSLFPINNLNIFNFNYSKDGSNIIISGNNIFAGISYCSFNNNINNNGVYLLSQLDDVKYQLIPDPVGSPSLNSTGFGRLSISKTEDLNMEDLPFFDLATNITSSTKYGILGCGRIFDNPNTQNPDKGIIGRVKPSIIATLKNDGIFSSTENMPTGNGLSYSYINGSPDISLVQSTNCYETGYFRISGIVVPKLGIFAPDAPPTKNLGSPYDFTHNSSNEAISILSYYGSAFSKQDNRRALTILYNITDIISNTGYISSSIGSNSVNSITFVGDDYKSASVFSLFLYNQPNIFPTYNIQSIPYSENEYFWIHKSGAPNDTPSDLSFPPIIVTGVKNPISCMSGQNISALNYSFTAIGGYVSAAAQGDDTSTYDIDDYPPYVTGIVQRSLLDNASGAIYSYAEFYTTDSPRVFVSSVITIRNFDSLIDKSPYYINFYRDTSINNNMELMYSTGLIFDSGNLNIDNNLLLTLDYAPITPDANDQLIDRQLIVNPSVIATTGSDPHYVYLQHNNIPFTTGASIDLLFNHQKQSSSAMNSFDNNIFNMLTIISGSEYEITGYCPNPNFISQTGYCGLRQNYHNQIKISNIQYSNPGFWNFTVTGIPTGLYKDYIYKIINQENIAPYQNWNPPLTSKKYTTEYSLQITKPIRILNTSLVSSSNSWTLNFDIDGGSRPVAYNFPEISINGSGCIFDTQNITSTQTEPLKYKYPYNEITDRLQVTLSSNSNIIDWSDPGLKNQALNLTVTDDSSSFTTGIIFMST